MDNQSSSGVGRGAIHLTIARIVTILISLLSSMFLSRFCTVEELGTYSQINLVITLVTSLLMLGLPNSINYFLAKADTPCQRRDFLSVYYSLNTALGIILGVILAAAVPLFESYFSNSAIGNFVYFLAIYPWATVTISSVGNVLVAYKKTPRLMLVNIVTVLVTLVSVLAMHLFDLGFSGFMLFFLIGNALIAISIYVMVIKLERGIRPLFHKKQILTIFQYAIPIGLASFTGTLNAEIDKLMIGRQMGTEALAIYTNAGKELPISFVSVAFTAVLLPQMVRILKKNKNEDAVTLWGHSIEICYLIICFFVTACVVFAPQIITILYSEKYLPGVTIFRIYALSWLFRVTYFGMMLNAIGRPQFIFWSSAMAAFINVGLNFLMYYALGFIGPAVATLISITLVNLVQLVFTARIIKVPFKRIFPWKALLLYSLANVAWGIGAYALVQLFGFSTDAKGIISSILMGGVVLICYAALFFKKGKKLWRKVNTPILEEEIAQA